MERDARLEAISDRIRHGDPVGFLEAIEAINYQESLREHAKQNTWWKRMKRRISRNANPTETPGVIE